MRILECLDGNLWKRHQLLVFKLNNWIKKAGYKTELDKSYYNDNNNQERTRPGDIVIKNYYNTDNDSKSDAYLDMVIVNNYASSYRTIASSKRLALAKQIQQRKIKKYEKIMDISQFIPCVMELHGGLGPEFKVLLQQLAQRISLRTGKAYSWIMSNIRQDIVTSLIIENMTMCVDCLHL